MPSRGYFDVYGRTTEDFVWWEEQVRRSAEFDWERVVEIDVAIYPDEIFHETCPEGAVKRVVVNAYERDPRARQRCIAHYGLSCSVCGMKFQDRYGDIGRGFIHVHHLHQLSSVDEGYEVDPIQDLRPVCPNCHAMLHTENPPMSIAQLKLSLRDA